MTILLYPTGWERFTYLPAADIYGLHMQKIYPEPLESDLLQFSHSAAGCSIRHCKMRRQLVRKFFMKTGIAAASGPKVLGTTDPPPRRRCGLHQRVRCGPNRMPRDPAGTSDWIREGPRIEGLHSSGVAGHPAATRASRDLALTPFAPAAIETGSGLHPEPPRGVHEAARKLGSGARSTDNWCQNTPRSSGSAKPTS